MSEAVIVATARTPIGRAFKGSLVDDAPTTWLRSSSRGAQPAARARPRAVDDLMLGCGLPGASRVSTWVGSSACSPGAAPRLHDHAVLLELAADDADGGARDQGRRGRRVHRRRGGGGEPLHGRQLADQPNTQNPRLQDREPGGLPDVYIDMGETAENVAEIENVSREEMDEYALALAAAWRRGDRARVLRAGDHAVHDADGTVVDEGRRPAPGHDAREARLAEARVPSRRSGDRRQRMPAERRCGRGDRDERHEGERARDHADGARSSRAVSPASTRRSWASARSRPAARPWPAPA